MMYSVSVRSEKWKLILFIIFKFSEVYVREGKYVFQNYEMKVRRYINVKFGVGCHNLSYKFAVIKIEEEDLQGHHNVQYNLFVELVQLCQDGMYE